MAVSFSDRYGGFGRYLSQSDTSTNPAIQVVGKTIFTNKQCHVCHGKGKKLNLADLKGQISPIFMAQLMWNHGPGMLEKMRKEKVPWQRFNGEEMADLMEYLNRGTP